jgi:hypothetical protein
MWRFHMVWSLWDTDTLWLCVITWSCIAWIAFVSAFTQPTWNINRRIARALIGTGGERRGASRRRKSRWQRRGFCRRRRNFLTGIRLRNTNRCEGCLSSDVCVYVHTHIYMHSGRILVHRLTRAILLGQTSSSICIFLRIFRIPEGGGALAISRERAGECTHTHRQVTPCAHTRTSNRKPDTWSRRGSLSLHTLV